MLVAKLELAELPVMLMGQVPVALLPPVAAAPTELYEIVTAPPPLKVEPEAAPPPALLKVKALETAPAVVAFVAFATAVEPIAETIWAAVAAVKALVPLPNKTPLRVVAPEPPLATGSVPVT